jgi:hypothetical protein
MADTDSFPTVIVRADELAVGDVVRWNGVDSTVTAVTPGRPGQSVGLRMVDVNYPAGAGYALPAGRGFNKVVAS